MNYHIVATFDGVVYRVRVAGSLTLTVSLVTRHVKVMTATLEMHAWFSTLSHVLPHGGGCEHGLEGGVVVRQGRVEGGDVLELIVHYCSLLWVVIGIETDKTWSLLRGPGEVRGRFLLFRCFL